ncbi:MAG: S-adenosylmethionine decarboxylase proenzyme [candidate division Zixibacteria bacterium]|nr:S-adenosylmethionine decarboxylase proenzyme [Candidatus Tariuqbacter arcticus]
MEDTQLKALGRQIMVEFFDCDRELLNDERFIGEVMKEAAVRCGATIVETVFHTFNPHGISGVVLIAESHLTIHTWPEYGYAAVDLFTCGEEINPEIAFDFLEEELKAGSYSVVEMLRGLIKVKDGKLLHKPETVG